MLKITDNKIAGRDIYDFLEVKTRYTDWVRRCIDYASLNEGKDFYAVLSIGNRGGRPVTVYDFTVYAAKEMCLVSATSKSKELRKWLISLGNQRENLELITVKEAAFAVKVINALKYIENQRIAYSNHQKAYIGENPATGLMYSEFAKYRTNIIGWDKESINTALEQHLIETGKVNKTTALMKGNMSEKLSFIDTHEAIRVAVLDILYTNGTTDEIAQKFATMVKYMSKELYTKAQRSNEQDLFHEKQELSLLEVKTLKLQ